VGHKVFRERRPSSTLYSPVGRATMREKGYLTHRGWHPGEESGALHVSRLGPSVGCASSYPEAKSCSPVPPPDVTSVLSAMPMVGHVLIFLSVITSIVSPRQQPQKYVLVYLNVYRINPQVHRYTVVAFHPESIRVSLFIFSQMMAWCKRVY
jgi:hypothetical protein